MKLTITVKDHPIFSQEFCQSLIDQGMSLQDIMTRGTGRSTAIALKLMAAAINNPGVMIQVKDHHGTLMADKHLFNKIQAMCHDLGFRYSFIQQQGDFYIKFGK